MGPVPSRCLSHFSFLKPQTDGFTVKIRARDDRMQAARAGSPSALWSGALRSCFPRDKTGNMSHTHKGAHHTANESLMAGSRKGLMAAMTLPAGSPWLPWWFLVRTTASVSLGSSHLPEALCIFSGRNPVRETRGGRKKAMSHAALPFAEWGQAFE